MAIDHKFVSAKTDGADNTLVQPSDWNDDHNHVPFEYTLYAGDAAAPAAVFTNLANAAVTEVIAARMRTRIDLTYAVETRLIVSQVVIAAAGTNWRVQYSTDGGTNWTYLDGTVGTSTTSGGPSVAAAASTANSLQVGSWTTLAAGAKADVLVRFVGTQGNGTADPSVARVALQVR